MFPDVISQRQQGVWATKIPYRNPEWKIHESEGKANSALSQRGMYESFAKYQLIGNDWHKVFAYVPSDTCRCDQKYTDVFQKHFSHRSSYTLGKFMLDDKRLYKGDLPLCYECYETERGN